jgi:hypothetical protein
MKNGALLACIVKVNRANKDQALLADRLTSRYTVIAWRNGIQITRAFSVSRKDAWDIVERNEQKMGSITIYVYKNGSKKHCFKSSVSNKARLIH